MTYNVFVGMLNLAQLGIRTSMGYHAALFAWSYI